MLNAQDAKKIADDKNLKKSNQIKNTVNKILIEIEKRAKIGEYGFDVCEYDFRPPEIYGDIFSYPQKKEIIKRLEDLGYNVQAKGLHLPYLRVEWK